MTILALPKLVTEGDTAEEILENVRDALPAVVEAYDDSPGRCREIDARTRKRT